MSEQDYFKYRYPNRKPAAEETPQTEDYRFEKPITSMPKESTDNTVRMSESELADLIKEPAAEAASNPVSQEADLTNTAKLEALIEEPVKKAADTAETGFVLVDTPEEKTSSEPLHPDGSSYYSKSDDPSGSSTYTYGATGYGSGNSTSYGSGATGYASSTDSSNTDKPSRKAKATTAERKVVSMRAFIITLILAMLVTSGLTVGGIALYDNHFAAGSNTATNYTLTKSSTELSYTSIVDKAKNSIVSITTEGVSTDAWAQNYVTKGAGSGVIVQSNGYIVTCYHVIEDSQKITVTTYDSKTYDAELIGIDEDNDLAVIKIKATGLDAIEYGDSSSLKVGDATVVIGNPLGELSNTATTGIVSALNRNLTIEGRTLNLLQTDASINPGNSGGALLDASGNLIGIVESKSTGSSVEGLGFAVPVNTVAKSVKQIIKNGKVSSSNSSSTNNSKAAIGVVISEISDQQAQMYGYSQGGVYITSVTSAKAQAAGVRSGDIISSFDGETISNASDLSKQLAKHKVGDKVRLELIRGNQTLKVNVTLVQSSEG